MEISHNTRTKRKTLTITSSVTIILVEEEALDLLYDLNNISGTPSEITKKLLAYLNRCPFEE